MKSSEALSKAKQALGNAIESIKMQTEQDFIAIDIKSALMHLGEITGDDINQEIQKKYEESMLKDALISFQQFNPEGYDIISKYYLNTPAMTMEEIAAEYNLSKPAIHLRIKKYLNELRNLMDSYLSQEKNSENTSKTT